MMTKTKIQSFIVHTVTQCSERNQRWDDTSGLDFFPLRIYWLK